MIPIEKQVTNLELSKRLAAAGVPQESYFVWACYNHCDTAVLIPRKEIGKTGLGDYFIAAFSPSELGEWLPLEINYSKELNLGEELKWWSDGIRHIEVADTLADAMGEMLDYLINKGDVKPEELK